MNFDSLLSPAAIRLGGKVTSKKRLFLILGEVAQQAYGLNADDTMHALLERENLGPTAVGQGVSLPHARLEGLNKVHGAFIKLENPLDLEAADRQGVDLVFALFAPANAGAEHLKALALVSRTLRDTSVRAKLRANEDPATLHAILTEGPASQAA